MNKVIYRNKGSKENIIISIEGPHGVGKTTIYTLLKKKADETTKFKFFPERYIKNPPFPFGSTNKQIAFRSEIHFLQQVIKRNQNIINFDSKYNGRIVILDRSPICVLIYSKSLNLKEKDFKLILDMYNSVKWREDYIIYLIADPDVILKRITQRGSLEQFRKHWNEEERDYLLKIISYYNQVLLTKFDKQKLFIIDTDNLNPEQVLAKVLEIITNLTDYSFKKSDKIPATQMSLIKFLK